MGKKYKLAKRGVGGIRTATYLKDLPGGTKAGEKVQIGSHRNLSQLGNCYCPLAAHVFVFGLSQLGNFSVPLTGYVSVFGDVTEGQRTYVYGKFFDRSDALIYRNLNFSVKLARFVRS